MDGISEIAYHCGKCISLVLLANRHAPNVDQLMTIVVNVHIARAVGYTHSSPFYIEYLPSSLPFFIIFIIIIIKLSFFVIFVCHSYHIFSTHTLYPLLILSIYKTTHTYSELNRWCYNRLDSTTVLNGDPRRQSVRNISGWNAGSPLGEIIPPIIKFLLSSNEIYQEELNSSLLAGGKASNEDSLSETSSSSMGVFETILSKEIGKFDEDFEISFTAKVHTHINSYLKNTVNIKVKNKTHRLYQFI